MSRHSARYFSAAARAAFAALYVATFPTNTTAQEWQPDAQHLDCTVKALSVVDFTSFAASSSAEIFFGMTTDGDITATHSVSNDFGEEASAVITFTAGEILIKASHPGKPNFENDDFWAMEIIRLKNGMLAYQWGTMKSDPPKGLIHRNLTQRRWALDTARNVADGLRACLDLREETQPPSKPPVRKEELLDRTPLELGQR